MSLELTETGLTTQPLAEIEAELQAAYRVEFGQNTAVGADTVFGQFISIASEREALLQQMIALVFASNNPDSAFGTALDTLCSLTATFRKGATASKSQGLVTGTPGTEIANGSQVRLIQTQELWNVVEGPFTIGAGETVVVTIEGAVTGAQTFIGTASSGWSIETPIVGWAEFATTADIDPEDVGRTVEAGADLRVRRKDELLINGNDLAAIKAVVGALETVVVVKTFENTDCLNVVDGIDPGAFETVVEGGDDTDIANAIFSRKPPGAEAFGSTTVIVADGEGGTIPIGFTRPADIDVFVKITVDRTSAEGQFPVNGAQLIEDAFLLEANARADINADVIPQSYYGVIFAAVRDPASDLDSITSCVVEMDTTAVPVGENIITIAIRERADFDTANTDVVVI